MCCFYGMKKATVNEIRSGVVFLAHGVAELDSCCSVMKSYNQTTTLRNYWGLNSYAKASRTLKLGLLGFEYNCPATCTCMLDKNCFSLSETVDICSEYVTVQLCCTLLLWVILYCTAVRILL